jgi:Ca2+-binding RTX toxin-like protein
MRSRALTLALTLTLGTALTAVAQPDVLAVVPATCAGRTVTIDLNQAGHPSPDRPASDVVLGTNDADEISTGAGDDVVCGGIGSDDIDGGAGHDRLYGQRGADFLQGGRGPDLLDGGADTPFGNEDWVSYTRSAVGVQVDLRITGPQQTGAGRDTIRGVQLALGSSHDDVLRGTDYGTWLIGGAGDDLLLGGAESDALEGGTGNDVLRGKGGGDYIDLDYNAGHDRAYGGAGPDQMNYATPGDRYFGGAGNDDMDALRYCHRGCSTPVRLHGGPGNETFDGSVNNELFDGGSGTDAVDYSHNEEYDVAHDGLIIDLALSGPQDTGYSGSDELVGIEKVIGTDYGDDDLSGSSRDETLKGGGGDDVLAGRGGDDRLDGGVGTDSCSGGPGHNELVDCE